VTNRDDVLKIMLMLKTDQSVTLLSLGAWEFVRDSPIANFVTLERGDYPD
jgi:hypothetical protein